ncbi:peptide ABC transporter ATP-binding protein [Virgibacillus profundi]|uniref:Peptide ABC transporter ATP-binding protein n=1 Tax=Virgibacillus profundi TaxID=2024555 RepID=A0A2A2I849_9BACI|nr:ABC transporter ATP-binding protein [Virgibacillus profundi]PAV27827.1 peptide ABC transporter ATP-binding protein [Virgibacillus profundi]PXY51954.1 ABC transporter ATP-binding protein [Virgibacillus profundi]
MNKEPVLDVEQLKTYFYLDDDKVARAVDNISFSIYPGETVALVGESGSGKSITALSVMQLINKPGRIVEGNILIDGEEIIQLNPKQMTKIRGNEIAMIFQEPMTALNPVYTIGNQITEILRKHKKMSKIDARDKAINLLKTVGIPRAEEIMKEYPHQLSGGMRQRVMIAMAISCEPKLLIADEPTTALDVTIQAQILDLMAEMKEKYHMALLLITHDVGVVSEYADRVMVMYGGQIVEHAQTKELLRHTKHPYTKGLLESLPNMDEDADRLGTIKGTVPPAYNFPAGCRFSARCPFVMEKCKQSNPELEEIETDHFVRCYLYENEGEQE